jgi:hypothetical protein
MKQYNHPIIYKSLTFIFLTTFSFYGHSQSVMKCSDNQGNISYHNNKSTTKGLKCDDTNLATIDKRDIKNIPPSNVNLNKNSNAPSNNKENISSIEQEKRNKKRTELLGNELIKEQQQLDIVMEMKNKMDKSQDVDPTQKKQIDELIKTHQSNINMLQKELKIEISDFKPLKSTVIPGLGNNSSSSNQPNFNIEGSKTKQLPYNIPTEGIEKNTKLPSIEDMQNQLQGLRQKNKNNTEKDSSQHIETIRRPLPNMSYNNNNDYQPLPTPLDIPNLSF